VSLRSPIRTDTSAPRTRNIIFTTPVAKNSTINGLANELIISGDVGRLTYMSKNAENTILTIIGDNCIGYIEAEYFGGQGGQMAILWQDGKRYKLSDFGKGVINLILKHFGVIAESGLDEFETINLGRHRFTEHWLDAG
jgi:hypothetical protein